MMRWHNLSRISERVEAHHESGRFVTLFGYEWTKQPNAGGHINCYFGTVADAPFFDSRHPESDTYEKLWARLDAWREETGEDVGTIPHHPAEAMYPFDFSATDYDDLAPLVEIYSQWGSSEYPGREGNRKSTGGMAKGEVAEWIRDGIGWGNVRRMWDERSYPGGLTAFHAPERTREAVSGASGPGGSTGRHNPTGSSSRSRWAGSGSATTRASCNSRTPTSPGRSRWAWPGPPP
ncbi:hypothetical protein BRC93_05625 [Halobacteriales archaeon QS_5_70_15]|nr:MAG: hypothetical protein BRC93_05625 [Halobacteriales archaeon QS_5_70_15]